MVPRWLQPELCTNAGACTQMTLSSCPPPRFTKSRAHLPWTIAFDLLLRVTLSESLCTQHKASVTSGPQAPPTQPLRTLYRFSGFGKAVLNIILLPISSCSGWAWMGLQQGLGHFSAGGRARWGGSLSSQPPSEKVPSHR